MVSIEKIKEERKKNKILFRIKNGNEVFANTIRRMILEEVPTLAIEDVEIKDNSSALYDEMLALRMGLTPIKTDLSSYRFPENEAEIEERSARCTLQIKLKASKKGYVYAEEAESADPKCNFVHDKMPIVKLLAKQKVDVTGIAVLGRGKDHAKWSPGAANFRNESLIKIGSVTNANKVMENCTDGVFELKNGKLSVVADKATHSNLLEYYSELDPGISLESTGDILFSLESWGQMSCKEILQQSAAILVDKVEEMEKLI